MTTATQLETKQRPWWLTLIAGILALIVGGILLWAPAKTSRRYIFNLGRSPGDLLAGRGYF